MRDNFDVFTFFNDFRGIEGYINMDNGIISNAITIDEKKENSDFVFGFDVGSLDINGYSYSSIFQEIIFATRDNFPNFFKKLNAHWLFPDYQTASDYLLYHKDLRLKGLDLEHEDILNIYRISKPT
jgi:hypothetical protein